MREINLNLLSSAGVLLALYGLYGVVKGSIYSKDGISARYVHRDEEPISFWLICACYVGVGILIFFAGGRVG